MELINCNLLIRYRDVAYSCVYWLDLNLVKKKKVGKNMNRHSLKKIYKWPIRTKKCPTSLVIQKMQIKTMTRCYFTLTKMDRIFKVITSVGKDVKKLEPSFNTGWKGNAKQCSHFGKQFGNSSNCFLKNRVTIWSRKFTPKYIPKRNKNMCPCKYLHTNVHSRIILRKNQKVETA